MKNITFQTLLKTVRILIKGFLACTVLLTVAAFLPFLSEFFSYDFETFFSIYYYIFLIFVVPFLAFIGCLLFFIFLLPILFYIAKKNEARLVSLWYLLILSGIDIFLIGGGIFGYLSFISRRRGYSCNILTYKEPLFLENIPIFFRDLSAHDYFIYWFFASLAATCIGIVATSILFRHKRFVGEKEPLHLLSYVFAILFIVTVFLFLGSESFNSARIKSVDARRISDLRQVQLALTLYDDTYGIYPVVSHNTSIERWRELERFLAPTYISILPQDPCFKEIQEHAYDYKSSFDGKSYVIKAILSTPKHAALKNYDNSRSDMDGKVFDIWCGEEKKELEYCVGPY